MGVRECPLKTDWALFGLLLSECKLQFVFALKTNSLRILLSLRLIHTAAASCEFFFGRS